MTGLIIWAAGESGRMGVPKQTLLYKGASLLQRAINIGNTSACEPVIVVLGAFAETILPQIDAGKALTIINDDWHTGMASSIVAGIRQLLKTEHIDSAVIMLCDQPFVTTELINKLIDVSSAQKMPIVACAYNNTIGVPAFFNRKYFSQLLALKGNQGAKKILELYQKDAAIIPFLLGSLDIDTKNDYENLVRDGI